MGSVIPFSVLDLSPIVQGGSAADAFRNTLDLARHAERWGYRRYWLAEHHNMPGVASAATAVVIGHVAGGTTTIRVGAGGVMLPNHAPLVIAEQFGTLESLYPGRIDLGLGRAPGTDQTTVRALRREPRSTPTPFRDDVVELQAYFRAGAAGAARARRAGRRAERADLAARLEPLQRAARGRARPAVRVRVALRAGSSDAGAATLSRASSARRRRSRSRYAMVGVSVFAAETDDEARRLFTSLQQQFVNLRRGRPGPLPPPVDGIDGCWTPARARRRRPRARLRRRRLTRRPCGAACGDRRPDRRRRADADGADLRPCRPPALVRARRRGARSTRRGLSAASRRDGVDGF